MATPTATPVSLPAAPAAVPGVREPESVWRAPLVPPALALTAGIVLDRYASMPLPAALAAAVACLLAWLVTGAGKSGLCLVYLTLATIAFGSAYHHYRRDVYPPPDGPRPVQVRGWLDEEPRWVLTPPDNRLVSIPPRSTTTKAGLKVTATATTLSFTALRRPEGWVPLSGRARLWVEGELKDLHVGDEVEVVGQLAAIPGPANPGEFDQADHLRDQGVWARLVVRGKPPGVIRLGRGWPYTPAGWLAYTRSGRRHELMGAMPPSTRGLAVALLLGDNSAMSAAEWDKYVRTGVIHILVISGQHLALLALILWWGLSLVGVRQRRGVVMVALLLTGYVLLTGWRPPSARAVYAVAAVCGALGLRRLPIGANLFALAWLGVALFSPTDLFTTGCQISFLCVAILYWGKMSWLEPEPAPAVDAVDQLVEDSRPAWQRGLLALARMTGRAYALTALLWVLVIPLAASSYHIVPPVGILLGPPLGLLTSIALLFGFPLLAVLVVCPPLGVLFAWPVHFCLLGCDRLVDWCDRPGGYFYVGDIPTWWLLVFFGGLLAVLTQRPLRRRWRWGVVAGAGWLCVGLAATMLRLPPDELRCTFLAVGHGGCTVLEVPDGRVLLYDAGALRGPDVTVRQIAPFLWHRGIRRVDEVFLSHADSDHFNGLVALMERFAVGQVTCTPSFADKDTPAAQLTLAVLRWRGVPVRTVKAGDRLAAGGVTLHVLHPPAERLGSNENARSLVLDIRYAGSRLLLTGDLEGAGLERVLSLPPRRVDVMMAPHHGSPRANTPELAAWARPRLVVSCQGAPRSSGVRKPHTGRDAQFLTTWEHGAVTVHSHRTGLFVETFVTRQRQTFHRENAGDDAE